MRKKLILDLDTGIDDAMAIAYALGSADEADLIGITATYGNVAVPLAARNALAVLHLFGRDDVPVYPGVDHPIAPVNIVHNIADPAIVAAAADDAVPPIDQAYADWRDGGRGGWPRDAVWAPSAGSVAVHHPNGIGGAVIPDSPREPEPKGSAVGFIVDAMRKYGPDLIVIPTGAMTTMATVFRNAPDVRDCGANVTFMGGSLTLPGNVSPAAEANISQDPEAADYLFKCGARTTMIGLDVTHQTALTREKAHQWADLGTPAGDFLVTMTDYYIDFYLRNQPEIHGCGLHDPLAVAAALDPSLVTTFGFNLQVDVDGPFRGRTIGDRSRLQDPDKHTQVALGVDVPAFLDRFMARVTNAAAVC
ncbi:MULTISPECIES: nucleoside hydrolase [unclassified Bifidobacterium]|uniref:nucleoside hydrolase n=1 Tax=unclassified Bifidobacterium TaxID=2608897 RepID=UPI001129141B|nr:MULTISPECIES: nucleoside hydrolase [unclassified Bifidobacterium]TPF77589.1 nucleoside hydrolase [Bifidobacterium sp. UTCIF-1]TPF79887.1 nucleoside hydrolase [Bifidobacterium sp. UTCIF-24]TPF81520.1 nucleoside hydrolase [Bifidobacterium sp. UTCIF-3]TPF84408.1 nucleoside hydrolase [Bifidobacterium sp. UTCIF-36]TPF88547.1 nucleoside hydrolase [Bifidobacterium sp. UTBIF-56]